MRLAALLTAICGLASCSRALLPGMEGVREGDPLPVEGGGPADRDASDLLTDRADDAPAAPPIAFEEFYAFGPRAPQPTAKLLGLNGKRVKLMGFMVQMERGPLGGFYLAPYPAFCDESGGGRGGLPPPSVLVLLEGARGKEVAFVDGVLEVTGILDVGNKAGEDGEAATIRLFVAEPSFIVSKARAP